MILQTLEILKDDINSYTDTVVGQPTSLVQIENISNVADLMGQSGNTVGNNIIMTLVNQQEETTLKNNPSKKHIDGKYEYQNSPVFLNLYILFSANRSKYTQSLESMQHIIAFFQSKQIFNHTNTPISISNQSLQNLSDFKITIELVTPTFEQLNYMWGTLGGKSYPAALYKARVLVIQRDRIQKTGAAISTTSFNLSNK